jgi:ACS family hexuronate transporter-like MFS transporter
MILSPSGAAVYHEPTSKKSRGRWWKWYICGVLFLATVLCYLDRQTMSLCAPLIKRDFNLTNQKWGELLSAFRGTYALVQFFGFLADLVPVRLLYASSVGLWSAAGAAAAFVGGPGALAWTRRLLGAGEAFNWPCALRVTANMLPPQDRSLANGIFTSGAATGAALSPMIIAPLASALGWRTAFFVVGAFGAAWILIWWFSTRRPDSLGPTGPAPVAGRREAAPPLSRQIRQMFGHPGFWLLLLVAGTVNPCTYFIAEWIPLYMHDQRGFGLVAAALASTPMFLGQDVGNVGGGGLVKYLAARGLSLRFSRGLTVALGAALVVPATLAGYVGSSYVCIALLILAATGLASVSANYLAAVHDISFSSVGLVAGVLGAFGNIVSWKLNPLIGRHVDQTGHYHLVFISLGILPIIGLASLLAFDAVIARRKAARPGPGR